MKNKSVGQRVYIFRVTNQNFADRPFRSVSQRVYIFIPTEPAKCRILAVLAQPVQLPGFIYVANIQIGHGTYVASINMSFKNENDKAVPARNSLVIINKYKLLINTIRSMEVNPFIRKLDSFFKGTGVFFLVR